IQSFTSESVPVWMEWSGISLADVLNEDDSPQMMLGAVGFLRAPPGAHSTFKFVYDEVLVVISGACTVESEGKTLKTTKGGVVYLPANTPGSFTADEALELVYVASPPYGSANREARAALLDAAAKNRDGRNV